jgi:hypothetical protein
MTSDARLVLGGIKSLVQSFGTAPATEWAVDANYCYAVWMRHLRMIADAGVDPVRETIVELGPGDSIGTGFAALLTTAQRYVALDVVPHAASIVHVALLNQIKEMIARRDAIPDATAFRYLFPHLRDYAFPADILPPERIDPLLAANRIHDLEAAIHHMADGGSVALRYVCPWSPTSVQAGTADLVFSQAVLQEIDNRGRNSPLRRTFQAMASWLKPGGVMSHQIDLGMYGAEPWDRQWTYNDATWSLIRGRRATYINREPLSTYETLCRDFGFEVVLLDVVHAEPATPTDQLAPRFRSLTQRDRTARAVHLVAIRR